MDPLGTQLTYRRLSSRRSHLILVALIVLALVGVALLAVPGSPVHRGVKKGLDLQGGLEVVLKAQPPKGHKLTADDLDRSVGDHAQPRRQARRRRAGDPQAGHRTRSSIQLAGVHDSTQAAKIIGSTAQLELYDLEPALVAAVDLARRAPVATASLYQLLSRVQADGEDGHAEPVRALQAGQGHDDDRHRQEQEDDDDDRRPCRRRTPARRATLHRDPTTGNAGPPRPLTGGKVPKGWKVLTVPAKTVVITLLHDDVGRLPGRSGRRCRRRARSTTTSSSTAPTRTTATRPTASTRT